MQEYNKIKANAIIRKFAPLTMDYLCSLDVVTTDNNQINLPVMQDIKFFYDRNLAQLEIRAGYKRNTYEQMYWRSAFLSHASMSASDIYTSLQFLMKDMLEIIGRELANLEIGNHYDK